MGRDAADGHDCDMGSDYRFVTVWRVADSIPAVRAGLEVWSVEHCRAILRVMGIDPDSGGIRVPDDPRLLTSLLGVRRGRADLAFLDEITPVLTPPSGGTGPVGAQLP